MRTKSKKGLKENPTADSSIGAEIHQDDLYDALSNSRRRHIIRALATTHELTLGDVALEIAAAENDCAPKQVSGQERKRVRIGLHQVHARRLNEWGVINWDKDRQRITRGPVYSVAYEAMDAVSGPLNEPMSFRERVKNFFGTGASA